MQPEDSAGGEVRRTRRRFDAQWKLDVIRKAMSPGASVAKVARDHDLNTNQLFKWCRRHAARIAEPAAVLPVRLDDARMPMSVVSRTMSLTIELPRGRLRLEGDVGIEEIQAIVQTLSVR